jgi:heme exporter protein D
MKAFYHSLCKKFFLNFHDFIAMFSFSTYSANSFSLCEQVVSILNNLKERTLRLSWHSDDSSLTMPGLILPSF